jgi:hypothetical protein
VFNYDNTVTLRRTRKQNIPQELQMHPSLVSPLNYTELKPQRSPSDPYVLCWCSSGKKWKFCHKLRESEPEIHVREYQRLVRKNYDQGRCLHPSAGPDTCAARAINSHTIQMNGGISTISEKQHVYTFKLVPSMDGDIFQPCKISVRKASTFLGFCNKHDTALFKPIETPTVLIGQETAFYMAYRAISYEYHGKQRAIAATPFMVLQDRGQPFEIQAYIQNYVHISTQGYNTGFRTHEKLKKNYDSAHLNKEYSKFKYFAIEFDSPSPIVACGAFCPEFDINDVPLQELSRGTIDFQVIAFNLLNLNGKSYAVFGWLDDPFEVAANYIESIKKHPRNLLSDLIVRISFQNLENTYVSPAWWDNLDIDQQQSICELCRTGVGPIPKTAESLHTKISLWPQSATQILP